MNAITTHSPDLLPAVLFDQDQEPVTASQGFIIDSLDKATWAASKVAQAQNALEDLNDLAQLFHSRIEAWLVKASKSHLDSIDYLSSLIRPFLTDKLAGLKSRSILLPGLRVGFRSAPPRVAIIDQQVALTYLETHHPEAVIVKKDIAKASVKALLQDGQSIPGLALESFPPALYVQGEA